MVRGSPLPEIVACIAEERQVPGARAHGMARGKVHIVGGPGLD